MTKIYISADMEGVGGVVNRIQVYPPDQGTALFRQAVAQQAAEIRAVVEGIYEVEPHAELVVNDAHNSMINLHPSDLPKGVRLISGKPKACAMMAGLDSTFDAVIFTGYHARAGVEKGVINHTYHNNLYDVQINGVSYGEGGINALYAGMMFELPIILGGGDQAFCDEIHQILPDLLTVETKVGLSTYSALCHPAEQVLSWYKAQVIKAMQERALWHRCIMKVQPPYTVRVTFTDTLSCDVVSLSPVYRRVGGRTVEWNADSAESLYRGLQTAFTILAYNRSVEPV